MSPKDPASQPAPAQEPYTGYNFYAKITVENDLKKENNLGVLLQNSRDALRVFFAAVKGKAFTEDDLKNLPVPTRDGHVRLGDFATVHVDFVERPAKTGATRPPGGPATMPASGGN